LIKIKSKLQSLQSCRPINSSSFVEFQILLNTYTRDNNDIQQARWENYFNKEDNKIKFIVEHGNNLDKNMKENFLELLKNMRKAFIAYKEGLESFLPSERRSAKKSSSSSSPSKISDFMSDDNLIKLQKEVKKFQLKVSLSYNQLSVEVDNDESMGVNDNNEEEEQKDEENIEIVSDHTKYWVQKEIEFDYKDISNDLPPFKDNFEVYFVKESKDSILDSFNFSLIINSEDTLMWFDSDRHQIKLLCPPKGDYIILDQNGEELQSLQYKDLSDLIKFDEQLENETSCWQLLCAEKINKLDGSKKFIKIFFSGIHSAKE